MSNQLSVININSCNINSNISITSDVLLLNNTGGNGNITINGGLIDSNNSGLDLSIFNNNYAIGIVKGIKSTDISISLNDACNGTNTVTHTNKDFRIIGYNYEGHFVDKFHTISNILQHCYNNDNSSPCNICPNEVPS